MQSFAAILVLSLWSAFGANAPETAPSTADVYTSTISISTYPYAPYLQLRHSAAFNMDYPWLNWAGYGSNDQHHPSPQDYTIIVMENPWLRLTFLPDLGGRLYGVTIKATGEELFYQNPVIKPTHWGPSEQGWWLAAGGIEWCLPVEEHGYEWGVPWLSTVSTSPDGATITLRDTSASDRIRAQIMVELPANEADFRITPRLENPTGTPISFKFWENAILAPGAANTVGPELRFVVPIAQVTIHSRGDGYLPGPQSAMAWPVYNGTDYSRLGNWNQWLGFFARPQSAQDWAGVYDQAALRGAARIFPHQVAVGVKGFGFGWTDPIPWTTWTDDGSTYVELHGGPSPTFWDSVTLEPGQTLQWTETWLPVHNLPVLSAAKSGVALGVRAEGDDLHLGVLVGGQHDSLDVRLWRKSDCTLLWGEDGLSMSPGETYVHIATGVGLDEGSVVLGAVQDEQLLAATGLLTCNWNQRLYLPVEQKGALALANTGIEKGTKCITSSSPSFLGYRGPALQ